MKIDDLEQVQKLVGLLRTRTQARTALAESVVYITANTGKGNFYFYAQEESSHLVLSESTRVKIQLELVSQLDLEIESLEERLIGLGVKVDP